MKQLGLQRLCGRDALQKRSREIPGLLLYAFDARVSPHKQPASIYSICQLSTSNNPCRYFRRALPSSAALTSRFPVLIEVSGRPLGSEQVSTSPRYLADGSIISIDSGRLSRARV